MSNRPDLDSYFINICRAISTRSTCRRRAVGCVIVDVRGHILSTGYNGVASGLPHCIDSPCLGTQHKSGEGLDVCQAIHAEANALLQCKDVYDISIIYVTAKPCVNCMKLIISTTCKKLVYLNDYPSDGTDVLAKLANIQLYKYKS